MTPSPAHPQHAVKPGPAHTSPTQPRPHAPTATYQPSPGQLRPAQPSPAQPSPVQRSPVQPTTQIRSKTVKYVKNKKNRIFWNYIRTYISQKLEFSGIIYAHIICVFDVKTMVFDKFQNFLELYTGI